MEKNACEGPRDLGLQTGWTLRTGESLVFICAACVSVVGGVTVPQSWDMGEPAIGGLAVGREPGWVLRRWLVGGY